MGEPEVKLKGYVQAHAGNVVYSGGSSYQKTGVQVGGIFTAGSEQKTPTFKADVQAGIGTTMNAKCSFNLNVPLNKHVGLDYGLSASYDRQTGASSFTSSFTPESQNRQYELHTLFPVLTSKVPGLNGVYHTSDTYKAYDRETGKYNTYYDDEGYHYLDTFNYTVDFPTSQMQTHYHKSNLNSEAHAGVTFKSNNVSVSAGVAAVARTQLTKTQVHEHRVSATTEIQAGLHDRFGIYSKDQALLDEVTEKMMNQTPQGHFYYDEWGCYRFERNAETITSPEHIVTKTIKRLPEEADQQTKWGFYLNGTVDLNKKKDIQIFGESSIIGGKPEFQVGVRKTL